ncbi:MAG: OsmC family protein [Nitriliruptoraceae bacterium]
MDEEQQRRVTLERMETGVYRARNAAGAELVFGSFVEDGFTPVELLLAAIGGCSAVDVDLVTGRRSEPERFEVTIEADKIRDEAGSILDNVRMTFHVHFPAGPDGDKARQLLPRAVRTSHDRTCTVSRTVEAATPVEVLVDDHA